MICGGAFGYFTVAGLGWQVWWQVALAGFGAMALSGFIIQRNRWILSFTRLILKIVGLAIVVAFIVWLVNRQ